MPCLQVVLYAQQTGWNNLSHITSHIVSNDGDDGALPAGESVETGAVTLDMQHMRRVSVAADHNTAWVEGGANMGQ